MNLQVRGNDENGNIDLFSPIAQEYRQKWASLSRTGTTLVDARGVEQKPFGRRGRDLNS